MDVSVIIVNWNTKELLRDSLASIAEKTRGVTAETIVVDNASSDGSAEMVRSEFPSVRLVEAGDNLGFGRANNLGAKEARGEYLFFLNSDTVLINDAITELASVMRSKPDCGIAGGNLTDREGKAIHSHSMALPGPSADLFRLIKGWPRFRYGKNWTYNHARRVLSVAYVTGADLMIRKDIFERAGGFDPDFFMYYEETELTNRVRKMGFRAYSVPNARITHVKGASLENLESVKSVVYTSKYRYMRKVFGPSGPVRAHVAFNLFCAVKIALATVARRPKTAARYRDMRAVAREAYRSVCRP